MLRSAFVIAFSFGASLTLRGPFDLTLLQTLRMPLVVGLDLAGRDDAVDYCLTGHG